jgi:hypothetical protein
VAASPRLQPNSLPVPVNFKTVPAPGAVGVETVYSFPFTEIPTAGDVAGLIHTEFTVRPRYDAAFTSDADDCSTNPTVVNTTAVVAEDVCIYPAAEQTFGHGFNPMVRTQARFRARLNPRNNNPAQFSVPLATGEPYLHAVTEQPWGTTLDGCYVAARSHDQQHQTRWEDFLDEACVEVAGLSGGQWALIPSDIVPGGASNQNEWGWPDGDYAQFDNVGKSEECTKQIVLMLDGINEPKCAITVPQRMAFNCRIGGTMGTSPRYYARPGGDWWVPYEDGSSC